MSWLSYSSLIPPNLFILLTAIGLVLAWRWTRLGLIVATVGGACLYLVSTPVVAEYLFSCATGLVDVVPSLPSDAQPGAIIVLASDYRRGQRYTVGPLTLERLAEAARQERRLGLPVLVSGGRPDQKTDDTLAAMMSAARKTISGLSTRWLEDRSRIPSKMPPSRRDPATCGRAVGTPGHAELGHGASPLVVSRGRLQ
jgi:uncharacterized SAM-binding protein YcdF (DUF218 family)